MELGKAQAEPSRQAFQPVRGLCGAHQDRLFSSHGSVRSLRSLVDVYQEDKQRSELGLTDRVL